ncbi:MAG: UvrD-helicase domain-containing protein [Anaerolineae bacterium]|nr:UvrD-helicase domain-containing protein [Anaerolineae bacterium]
MTFTGEQEQAIFIHDKNLIVTAGAGSGKTRVLVERYLKLLEVHADWKLTDLVAITFTEKAAREMRDRVRLTIQKRIQNASEEAQLTHWQAHESLLDSARIGTIHSLCAQILRANPAEVPVDPHFEVLDEVEASILMGDAVAQSLAELVQTNSPASRLLAYYDVYTVTRVLKKFASLSESRKFCDAVPENVADLLARWQTEFESIVQKLIMEVRSDQELADLLAWQPSVPWPQEDKLMDSWRVVHGVDVFAAQPEIVFDSLNQLGSGIKLTGGTQKNWGSKEAVQECKEVLKSIRESAQFYLENWPRPLDSYDELAADLLVLWREAIQHTVQSYKRLKDLQGVLDFDDLEFLTHDLLIRNPHVAERYCMDEFKHVMVDEFQDTNETQRQIVYKLCGMEQPIPGHLFVVGDPKQSIYAFRGADVNVFHQVRQEITLTGGEELPLSRSFRTHDRLVQGFNKLFEWVLGTTAREKYEVALGTPMTAARASEESHHTPIRLLLMEKPESKSDDMDSDQMRRWEAYEVARLLHALKQSEMPVYDREKQQYRPFDYGDAAILLRAMTHAATYEEVFKAAELPYVTIAGKGYYNRQEVWDLINLLKALHNRADNLALAAVLRSPMFGLSDDALFALRLQDSLLWDALQQPSELFPSDELEVLVFVRDTLSELAALAGRVPVAELLSAALDKTAYDAILTALPNGDRRRGNIEKLMEKARQSGRISLSDFTAYLGDLTATDPREGEAALEGSGSVKMMSVHASKGLEFPVVVLMDCNWVRNRTDSSPLRFDEQVGAACKIRDAEGEWVKLFAYQQAEALEKRRETAEHKRLFYVAATRAQDLLVMTACWGGKAREGSWLHEVVGAFGIESSGMYSFDWGGIAVEVFTDKPSEDHLSVPRMEVSGWDVLQNHLTGKAALPSLLHDLPLETAGYHLTVSQLEQLGDTHTRRDFRNSVLHDAPAPISPILIDETIRERVLRRTVGQIVHRALQRGVLPGQKSMHELYTILRAYAWDEGLTDQRLLEIVTNQALRLLHKFESDNMLAGAEAILREVPFILKTESRIIHGQIDVLFKRDNAWHVLDYKTADIPAHRVREHSKRYYLQVGIYARAVEKRTGQTPHVQLYYLHPGTLISVQPYEWEQTLMELEKRVNYALTTP